MELARSNSEEENLRAEWNEQSLRSEKEVRKFYSSSEYGYLFSHALADRFFYDKFSLVKEFGTGKDYLDYGAGLGAVAMYLKEFFPDKNLTLADLPSTHFRFAKFRFRKYGIPVSFLEIPEEGYPRGEWDTIYSFDVLEHIVDWEECIDWMNRALRPGGRLLLIVSFDLYTDRALHLTDRTGLNEETLKKRLGENGMKEVEIESPVFVFEKTH